MAVAEITTEDKIHVEAAPEAELQPKGALGLFQDESPILLVCIVLGLMSLVVIAMAAFALAY